MSASLSGRYERFGRQALAGVQSWVDDTNAQGGLRLAREPSARPVVLHVYDDGSRVAGAAQATNRLLTEDHADLLLGPYSSPLTRAVAQVAAQFACPIWNHGGAADDLYTRGNPWIIGVLAPASRYFAGLVQLARERYGDAPRLGLVGAGKSPFATAVLHGAETLARAQGFEVVLRGDHRSAAHEAEITQQLHRVQPDLTLVAGSFEQDLALAAAIAGKQPGGLVGLVAAGVDDFGKRLGAAANGFFGPSQWEASGSDAIDVGPTAEYVARRLRRVLRGAPDYPAAQAYAAGLIAQRCLAVAGSLDSQVMREAAGQLHCTTFYGRYGIDETGKQVRHLPVIVRWKDGQKHVVWPTRSV